MTQQMTVERIHALNMRSIGRPVASDDRVSGLPDGVYDDPPTQDELAARPDWQRVVELEHRDITQTQSCARGEHMYVTGRRSCPLCGEVL